MKETKIPVEIILKYENGTEEKVAENAILLRTGKGIDNESVVRIVGLNVNNYDVLTMSETLKTHVKGLFADDPALIEGRTPQIRKMEGERRWM